MKLTRLFILSNIISTTIIIVDAISKADNFGAVLRLEHQNLYSNLNSDYLLENAMQLHMNPTNLTGLILPGNNIFQVHPTLFRDFPNVYQVDLSRNRLRTAAFQAPNVRVLNLEQNQLFFIDFPSFPSLEIVKLSQNNFDKIDWDLGNLTISEIDLSDNENLTQVRIKSEYLQILALKRCNLEEIKLDCPNLEKLDFRRAKFDNIDGEAIFEKICKTNTNRHFSILYLDEDDSLSQFECAEHTLEAALIENLVLPPDCGLTTLRINKIDDVVISRYQYDLIVSNLYMLASLIVVLILLNVYVLNLVRRAVALDLVPEKYLWY